MLLEKNGGDTLYLHASVESNLSTVSAPQAATRGVPVHNADDFATVSKSFSVTAYTDAGVSFMSNEEISVHSGNVWSPSGERYWPDDGAYLNFYAHAPYSIPQEGESNLAPTCSEGTISFDYTVPVSSDGTADAVAQPDILFAYARSNKSDAESNRGHVPLNFYHALAAVKFVTKNIAKCTINSITLKGLQGKGSCVFDGKSEAFTWELPADGGTTDFTQTFNVEVQDQQSGEQVITDKAKETTFMMIPQSLSNATVEILLTTDDGKEHTLTGKLAGTGEDQQAWEAGHIYTYAISTESINWTYVFEVTDNITIPLGGTKAQYKVTSYRYRTQNPSVKERVAWSAKLISATETDSAATKPSGKPIEADDLVTKFKDEGEGSVDGESCDFVLLRNEMHTDYGPDKILKGNTPKGTEEEPYDLSMEGGTKNTANCYVVNAPGVYKLPLVYGNAIKDGQTNTEAYKSGIFKDYMGNLISGPDINGADDCTLVWSDGFYMFKDVHLSEDKKYLVFSLDKDYMQQANAIVAVRDAADNIMWSWHIWVTKYNLWSDVVDVADWEDQQDGVYKMMKYNLGWIDGKMVYYNQRDFKYDFKQYVSERTASLDIRQEGARFDYKDVGSTYYQWGRKDPIIALQNWYHVGANEYRRHETWEDKYKYSAVDEKGSIGDAIKNPNVFYAKWGEISFDARLWDSNGGGSDAKTSTKTVYDPSPRGFKVPVPRVFSVFVEGSVDDGDTSQEGWKKGTIHGERINEEPYNKYKVYPTIGKKENMDITLIATGQRAERNGALEVYTNADGRKAGIGGLWAMYGVYFWSCCQAESTSAKAFVLREDWPSGTNAYSYLFNGNKAMARPVRCILDK